MSELYVVPALLRQDPRLPAPLMKILEAKADGGYILLSTVLQALSERDIATVLQAGAAAQTDTGMMLSLSMFCVMMATHEGLVVNESDNCSEYVSRFMVFLQAESLVKRGLMALPYPALTFEKVNPAHFVLTKFGREKFKARAFKPTLPPSV